MPILLRFRPPPTRRKVEPRAKMPKRELRLPLRSRLPTKIVSMWKRCVRPSRSRSQSFASALFKCVTGLSPSCVRPARPPLISTRCLKTGFTLLRRPKWMPSRRCVLSSKTQLRKRPRFRVSLELTSWTLQSTRVSSTISLLPRPSTHLSNRRCLLDSQCLRSSRSSRR